MARFRPHPAQLALALAVVANTVLSLGGCAAAAQSAGQTSTPSQVLAAAPSSFDAAMRLLLTEPSAPLRAFSAGTLSALQAYYAQADYVPLWVEMGGLTQRGVELMAALAKARDAGASALQPIMTAVDERRAATSLIAQAELEILLSGALLDTAIDTVEPTVSAPPADLLPAAMTTADVSGFLRERLPPDAAFWRLRDAVLVYSDLAADGGWIAVPAGPKLEAGMRDARIVAVRARLAASGDLEGADGESDLYDAALRHAIERFQSRHGLKADGVIGTGTLEALNVPVEVRLATMRANLRRLQQQGREWGSSYLAVNIAAASYRLVDDGETLFEHVAIVGQPDWQTPEVDSQIERIELNPYWTVPERIARMEVQPAIEKDPDYLAKHNMQEVGGFYRQDPGDDNALGKAKFLFPNPYEVYLHDTNSHRLFQREGRFLSHGCVRVPNAVELAELLLRDDPRWTREKVDEAIGLGKNRSIALKHPIPVHIVYDTAWVDEAGAVEFRKDIYRRDGELQVASTR
jgi:murein L,D-transpeptidase YcbB/YkuD